MIIVAGEVRVAPGTLETLKPAMEKMLAASRDEEGCLAYTYAVDVLDPTVIRVFERWENEDALERHFRTDHMNAWRQALGDVTFLSRSIKSYEVTNIQDR